jgi:positive regulator of sigma E activity
LIILFITPLAVGFGYTVGISEKSLKIAYAYMLGIFIPSTIYFLIWLITGLKFNLEYWGIINIAVFVIGFIYWKFLPKELPKNYSLSGI